MDGRNCAAAPDSFGPHLGLAYSSQVLLVAATLIWVAIILFSLVGPVPINDLVKAWDTQKLPPDWREQRRHWDRLNAIRVVMIALAFLALILSYKSLVMR
jgi:hypothetical protein